MKCKLTYLILSFLLPVMQSCVFDKEECIGTERTDSQIELAFTIAMEHRASTKADDHTWGDNLDVDSSNDYPDKVGNSFENYIEVNSLRVFAYDAAGNYLAEVKEVLCRQTSPSTETGAATYEFLGILQDKDSGINADVDFVDGTTYRYVILANCSEVSYNDGVPDLGNQTFTNTWESFIAPGSAIPMWGATDQTMVVGSRQDIGTIYLLRSLAKVEVRLDDAVAQDFRIKEASINRTYTTGYCAPHGWNRLTTESLYHLGSTANGGFRPYVVDDARINAINMSATSTSGQSFVLYLPETPNSLTDPLYIDITVSDSEKDYTFEKAIVFCNYTSGSPDLLHPYDIVRNHYYRFDITGVKTSVEVNFNLYYDVWPMDEETVTIPSFE